LDEEISQPWRSIGRLAPPLSFQALEARTIGGPERKVADQVLEVYLDESLSYFGLDPARTPLLVIAGYVAEEDEWESFSKGWAATLQAFQLSHFHAKELRSSDARLYRHLSFGQRRDLLSRLSALITKHTLLGVASYMRPTDYKHSTTPDFRARKGSTYGALVDLILMTLSNILVKPAADPERVNIFLESGHKNSREALCRIEYYKQETEPVPNDIEGNPNIINNNPLRTCFMRIGAYGLAAKREALPLQAADLLAYLIGAAAHMKDSHPVFDDTLDNLLQSRPHVLSPWGTEAVRTLIEAAEAGDREAAESRREFYHLKRYLRSFGLKLN
jgi:Protein of unknown function (DUF3800)